MEELLYDGQALKQAFKSAELVLEKRIDEINSLNVFPVPDGDTGINMYLTLQSANDAVKDLTSTSAAEISSKAAMGALLGARGNSGVILSQIMRGLSRGLENKEKFSAVDFARALHQASDTAYKSLAEPVEGTILTVIREAADRAMQKAETGADLKNTLSAATLQAKDTVTRTPEMLPTLKDAGVVDAGGKGLFYFFQGMKDFIIQKMNPVEGYKAARRKAKLAAPATVYGFDLQFLIEGENLPVAEIRKKVTSMGESVLVVGDENLVRVHVHTKQSQAIMDYCATKGCLNDIINDNMDNQVEDFKNKAAETEKPRRTARSKSRSRNAQLSSSTSSV
jgi:DAK2 domain fusion protein YloV